MSTYRCWIVKYSLVVYLLNIGRWTRWSGSITRNLPLTVIWSGPEPIQRFVQCNLDVFQIMSTLRHLYHLIIILFSMMFRSEIDPFSDLVQNHCRQTIFGFTTGKWAIIVSVAKEKPQCFFWVLCICLCHYILLTVVYNLHTSPNDQER